MANILYRAITLFMAFFIIIESTQVISMEIARKQLLSKATQTRKVRYAAYEQRAALNSSLRMTLFPRRKSTKRPDRYILQTPATVYQTEALGERLGTCFVFTLSELLNIQGQAPTLLPISDASDLFIHCNILANYFDPVSTPKKADIVIYTRSNHAIRHIGRVLKPVISSNNSPCTVASKKGTHLTITHHELFDVSKLYGKKTYFFRLKPYYQKNKNLVLQGMQKDIKKSPEIQWRIARAQCCLISNARGFLTTLDYDRAIQKMPTAYSQAWHLLKTCMGLSVNTATVHTQTTVLMFATKRNDLSMMELFLAMGANASLKDVYGNTALSIAQNAGYTRAANLLKKYIHL